MFVREYRSQRENRSFERLEWLYRQLKDNYEKRRDFPQAGEFYYGEMEMKRLSRWYRRFTPFSLTTLYWALSGYGERTFRALAVFVILLIAASFFATVPRCKFIRADYTTNARQEQLSETTVQAGLDYSDALEYSFRELTLVARESSRFRPASREARLLTLAQNVLGPVQLGMFLLAIRRRFRR